MRRETRCEFGVTFAPRRADYLTDNHVPVNELRDRLALIADARWGYQLRRGHIELNSSGLGQQLCDDDGREQVRNRWSTMVVRDSLGENRSWMPHRRGRILIEALIFAGLVLSAEVVGIDLVEVFGGRCTPGLVVEILRNPAHPVFSAAAGSVVVG